MVTDLIIAANDQSNGIGQDPLSLAIISGVVALVSAIVLRYVDKWVGRSKVVEQNEAERRRELKQEIESLKGELADAGRELEDARQEIDKWRKEYYAMYEQYLKIKYQYKPRSEHLDTDSRDFEDFPPDFNG